MHWADIREATFVPGIRLLAWTHRLLGRRAFRAVLLPVVLWYAATRPVARRASREYLARLHACTAGASPAPGGMNVLRHFMAFAECLLDRMLVRAGRVGELAFEVHRAESLVRYLATGRGLVVMTAHMGNFELMQVLARHYVRRPINVLMHVEHARRFDAYLRQRGAVEHVRIVPVTELTPAVAAGLARAVEQGELVAIAGDRAPLGARAEVVHVPFLGAPAAFPMGPYVLASLLGCPLAVVLATARPGGYRVSLQPLADEVHLSRADRRGAAAPLAARFAALLETECRAAPLQWFNFYPFWEG